MFQTMFARVFNDCRRVVADFVERNFDMVGLLLVVMLIARYSEGRGAAERYLRPFFASILSLVRAMCSLIEVDWRAWLRHISVRF